MAPAMQVKKSRVNGASHFMYQDILFIQAAPNYLLHTYSSIISLLKYIHCQNYLVKSCPRD